MHGGDFGGTIVRIGLGSGHVGFECKEHPKARSVGEGTPLKIFRLAMLVNTTSVA
jgi:hypothetical protein